ncbi:MAG: bifunctional DNA-formamidopyrimidine glycosylase/DNA-(apurinic or apyrimidinic site) lyase [Candidatus Falkowbacteria bacterium]|nr:bifunctional DNA-formamidopyrimidine glycosylase/DNA-(apurinic or apyrimidinic site) lyase [Candidatus Falkowbacteria bacterium]
MPELPEVETIRRDLEVKIVGHRIKDLKILSVKTVALAPAVFYKNLIGQRISKVLRRAKLLIIRLEPSNKYLLVHLKMTGQLIYKVKNKLIVGGHSSGNYRSGGRNVDADDSKNLNDLPNKHTRVIFTFTNSSQLFFNDLRKFGYLKLVTELELEGIVRNSYGIEPLTKEFSLINFSQALKGKKTNIKAALLNQKNIAGLGNIYVDESLFAARINPKRRADSLKPGELKVLWLAITKIIKRAVEYRGTTFNNYVDSAGRQGNFFKLLKIYGRGGEKCPRCHNPIKKIKLAGRGTHYCPVCQL